MSKVTGIGTYNPGFWGRATIAATSAVGLAGGTVVVVDQMAANREEKNKITIERTIDDLKSGHNRTLTELGKERTAREVLESNAKIQAESLKQVEQRLQQAQDTADAATSVNGDLNDRLDQRETENSELKQKVDEQSKTIEQMLITAKEIIAKSGPSAVNISSGPDDKYAWSGTIIKDNNGKRYLLTCGHSWSDLAELYGVGDPDEGKFKVTGYESLFQLTMKPTPLPSGIMAFSSKADIAVFPISKEHDEILDNIEIEKEVTIGITLENIANDFNPYQELYGAGNPKGRKDSHYRGELTNPRQGLAGALKQPRLSYGFIPGNSGMGLVNKNGKLTGMAISVTPDYVATANMHGTKHLKIELERVGIPVMDDNEKKQIEFERALSSFMLSTPSNPYAQIASSLVSETQDPLLIDSVTRPLAGFFMPTNTWQALGSLLPKQK